MKRKETSSDEGEPEESRVFPWMISLSLFLVLSEKLQGFGKSSCLLKKLKEPYVHLHGPLVGWLV